MLPKKVAILELAKELFLKDNPDAPTPEEEELVESGYYHTARNQLMRNDTSFEAYLEEQTAQNGYRIVTEEEHSKLIEMERAKEQARKERQKTKRLEEQLERIRSEKQKKETKPQEALPFDYQEALTTGLFVSGTSGSGKSDIGMYAADKLTKEGVTVIVFDPTQDWQERSSIPYYQTVRSTYIDEVPKQSVIYDISRLSVRRRQSLVEKFCSQLRRQQAETPKPLRKKYFIFFEEAHTYFKEGSMRANRLENSTMLLSDGRNYDVRFGCITQFSSMIDKQAMRYMKQRYFGFSDEPNDVEYIENFIGKRNIEELKSLEAGEFLYYRAGKITKISIEPYSTEKKPIKLQLPQYLEQAPKTEHKKSYDSSGVLKLAMLVIWLFILAIAVKPT